MTTVHSFATPSERLAAFFDATKPRPAFDDHDIDNVARLLKECGHVGYKCPRTYIVFRRIGHADLLEQLVEVGFQDQWFPVEARSLPSFLEPSVKAAVVEHQTLILTKTLDLENGRHRHFAPNEALPFDILGRLGSGGYGQVDRVVSKISYHQYALKRIRRRAAFGNASSREAVQGFLNEMKIMRALNHRHVVRYIGSYTDKSYLGLVMSPVAETDLAAYLDQLCARLNAAPGARTPSPFFMQDQTTAVEMSSNLRTYYGCLAAALNYLHDQNVRHKDIKPQNILVLKDNILFSDFGLSRDFADDVGSTTSGVTPASPRYCAPEVANYESRNTSSDIWSLGCVYLEMTAALQGSAVTSIKQVFLESGSKATHYHANPAATTQLIRNLQSTGDPRDTRTLFWIEKMINIERGKRPTAMEVLEMITFPHDIDVSASMFCGICCVPDLESDSVDSLVDDFDAVTTIPYSKSGTNQTPSKAVATGTFASPSNLILADQSESIPADPAEQIDQPERHGIEPKALLHQADDIMTSFPAPGNDASILTDMKALSGITKIDVPSQFGHKQPSGDQPNRAEPVYLIDSGAQELSQARDVSVHTQPLVHRLSRKTEEQPLPAATLPIAVEDLKEHSNETSHPTIEGKLIDLSSEEGSESILDTELARLENTDEATRAQRVVQARKQQGRVASLPVLDAKKLEKYHVEVPRGKEPSVAIKMENIVAMPATVHKGVFGIPLLESLQNAAVRVTIWSKDDDSKHDVRLPLVVFKCGERIRRNIHKRKARREARRQPPFSVFTADRTHRKTRNLGKLIEQFNNPSAGYGAHRSMSDDEELEAADILHYYLKCLPEPVLDGYLLWRLRAMSANGSNAATTQSLFRVPHSTDEVITSQWAVAVYVLDLFALDLGTDFSEESLDRLVDKFAGPFLGSDDGLKEVMGHLIRSVMETFSNFERKVYTETVKHGTAAQSIVLLTPEASRIPEQPSIQAQASISPDKTPLRSVSPVVAEPIIDPSHKENIIRQLKNAGVTSQQLIEYQSFVNTFVEQHLNESKNHERRVFEVPIWLSIAYARMRLALRHNLSSGSGFEIHFNVPIVVGECCTYISRHIVLWCNNINHFEPLSMGDVDGLTMEAVAVFDDESMFQSQSFGRDYFRNSSTDLKIPVNVLYRYLTSLPEALLPAKIVDQLFHLPSLRSNGAETVHGSYSFKANPGHSLLQQYIHILKQLPKANLRLLMYLLKFFNIIYETVNDLDEFKKLGRWYQPAFTQPKWKEETRYHVLMIRFIMANAETIVLSIFGPAPRSSTKLPPGSSVPSFEHSQSSTLVPIPRPRYVNARFSYDETNGGNPATDLFFKKNDEIRIIKSTGSRNDWWTGELHGKQGIFPANYVNTPDWFKYKSSGTVTSSKFYNNLTDRHSSHATPEIHSVPRHTTRDPLLHDPATHSATTKTIKAVPKPSKSKDHSFSQPHLTEQQKSGRAEKAEAASRERRANKSPAFSPVSGVEPKPGKQSSVLSTLQLSQSKHPVPLGPSPANSVKSVSLHFMQRYQKSDSGYIPFHDTDYMANQVDFEEHNDPGIVWAAPVGVAVSDYESEYLDSVTVLKGDNVLVYREIIDPNHGTWYEVFVSRTKEMGVLPSSCIIMRNEYETQGDFLESVSSIAPSTGAQQHTASKPRSIDGRFSAQYRRSELERASEAGVIAGTADSSRGSAAHSTRFSANVWRDDNSNLTPTVSPSSIRTLAPRQHDPQEPGRFAHAAGVALMDYVAQAPGYVSVMMNDQVLIMDPRRRLNDNWEVYVPKSGTVGRVPAAYIGYASSVYHYQEGGAPYTVSHLHDKSRSTDQAPREAQQQDPAAKENDTVRSHTTSALDARNLGPLDSRDLTPRNSPVPFSYVGKDTGMAIAGQIKQLPTEVDVYIGDEVLILDGPIDSSNWTVHVWRTGKVGLVNRSCIQRMPENNFADSSSASDFAALRKLGDQRASDVRQKFKGFFN